MLPVGSYIVHKVLYIGLLIRAKLHDYELLNGFERTITDNSSFLFWVIQYRKPFKTTSSADLCTDESVGDEFGKSVRLFLAMG